MSVANITEYGLVTIVYNHNLQIDDKYIIVDFEQLSFETAIELNWTLLHS